MSNKSTVNAASRIQVSPGGATRGSARQAAQRAKRKDEGANRKSAAGAAAVSRFDSSLGLLARKFADLIQVSVN